MEDREHHDPPGMKVEKLCTPEAAVTERWWVWRLVRVVSIGFSEVSEAEARTMAWAEHDRAVASDQAVARRDASAHAPDDGRQS